MSGRKRSEAPLQDEDVLVVGREAFSRRTLLVTQAEVCVWRNRATDGVQVKVIKRDGSVACVARDAARKTARPGCFRRGGNLLALHDGSVLFGCRWPGSARTK